MPITDSKEYDNEIIESHDLVDLELSGHGFKRSPNAAAISSYGHSRSFYANLPTGVRSAIVASTAIIVTTIITFVVIFIVYRWKQKQKRRLCYLKTYNSMKNKLPTMNSSSKHPTTLKNTNELIANIATIETTPVHLIQSERFLLSPRNSTASPTSTKTIHKHLNCHGTMGLTNGLGSRTGSTSSLALSLQSISSTKLNSLDNHLPEVQEYLFHTMKKSYDH